MNKSQKIKKSLFYSIVDGSFWSLMFGFGENYLSAFAIFLKATNFQLGLLSSLPLLFGSVCQFFSLKLIDFFKSRKRFVIISAVIQAFTWIPILLVFYFGKFNVYFLILFVIFYWISGMIAGPAWNSWISDLVDPSFRGRYFAKRNKIIGFFVLVAIVLGGIILDFFKGGVINQFTGFVILFLIAFVSRLASAYFLNKKYEPQIKVEKEKDKFTFLEFVKQARFRNYGLFVIFLTLMNFSVFIAAPFFVAYMLYDLKFSYFQYMILIAAAFLAKYFSLPVFGKLTDKYGNKKILAFTGYLVTMLSLIWIVSPDFYYILFVQIVSGTIWAGFELSSFNFVFDTTTPEKRARCISYYNMLNGIMIFLGSILGVLIVKYNSLFWTKYYMAFLVSGIFRIMVSVILLPKLREVRRVSDISYDKIFFKFTHEIIMHGFNRVNILLTYPRKLIRSKE